MARREEDIRRGGLGNFESNPLIENFADTVVWPFIDDITGYKFYRRPIGERSPDQIFLDPHETWPKNTFRLIVSTQRSANDEVTRSADRESISIAQLIAEQVEPELTAPLHRYYAERLLRGDLEESRFLPVKKVQAWDVREYLFKKYLNERNRKVGWLAVSSVHHKLRAKEPDHSELLDEGKIFGSAEDLDHLEVDDLNWNITELSISTDDVDFLRKAIGRVRRTRGLPARRTRG